MLFTRDLRVHDHPALMAACADADRVVPLFVFDDHVYGHAIASPNKMAFLLDSVDDLAARLRDLGGALYRRRGRLVEQVGAVAAEAGADAVYLSDDVTAFAGARVDALRTGLDVDVQTFPGVTVVPPGELTTASGGAFQHFTPYWRAWQQRRHREPVGVPDAVRCPSTLAVGSSPELSELVHGELSPDLPRGGEAVGRARLEQWLARDVRSYDDGHDDLAGDCTSRLSPYLHLGCVSAAEVVACADRRRFGVDASSDRSAGATSSIRWWRRRRHQHGTTTTTAVTHGAATTKRSRHGVTAGPATRLWTPACGSCAARGGCTTAHA